MEEPLFHVKNTLAGLDIHCRGANAIIFIINLYLNWMLGERGRDLCRGEW